MPLEIPEAHFNCSQNLGACPDCALVVAPRAFSDMVVRQAEEKPRASVVHSRLFVTGATDQSGFTSTCRFLGKCSALDMVMIFEAL